MRKVIRLTESELVSIIKKVIMEQVATTPKEVFNSFQKILNDAGAKEITNFHPDYEHLHDDVWSIRGSENNPNVKVKLPKEVTKDNIEDIMIQPEEITIGIGKGKNHKTIKIKKPLD